MIAALAVCVALASIACSALTVHYGRVATRERERLQAILDERAARV